MAESGKDERALAPLRARAVDAVASAFENDLIEVDELERRMALARRTESDLELRGLISASTPPHPRLIDQRPDRGLTFALFGSSVRAGRWTMPAQLTVPAVFGSVELDLREVLLGPRSEIYAFAVFGSVEIIVPPDVRVEVDGAGILGSFDDHSEADANADSPVLRVTGLGLFGSVEVMTRLPGESAREAKKRRKRAAKSLPARGTR